MKVSLYALLFLCIVSTASAANFEYNINRTSLPFTKVETVLVNGIANLTVNITYSNFTSGPRGIYFNTTGKALPISINIPVTTRVANYSTIVHLEADKPGYSTDITFLFRILNNSVREAEFVQLDINEYQYFVCDFSLPMNFTQKNLAIHGTRGMTVRAVFNSSWFRLPQEFIIPQSNTSIINVTLVLKNLSVKEYVQRIKFDLDGSLANVTYHVTVKDCIPPPPQFNDMVRICAIMNKTTEQALECQRLTVEYQTQLYKEMLEAQKTRVQNNTVTKYVNFTERVPVLDLKDPEIIRALTELPTVTKQMLTELRNSRLDNDKMNERILAIENKKQSDINNLSSTFKDSMSPLVDESREKQSQYDKLKAGSFPRKTIYWIVGVIAAIGLLLGGWYWYEENNPY